MTTFATKFNNKADKSEFMEQDEIKWTILKSEYLIKRPWLTARRDKVKLPDGRIIPEYYVFSVYTKLTKKH